MGNRTLGVIFAFFLILTYAGGFNMLASFNLQSTFAVYGFYHEGTTPWLIGGILALLVGYCISGGGSRIIQITSIMVPFMGGLYILAALIVVILHVEQLPHVFALIFADAFDFEAIFGGIAGSCMIYGIKRGLYSNEAGIGSAPNAAAAADVSHPVKQGLVQMLSVFIDTILVCSATVFLGLCSGVPITTEAAGAVYIQQAATATYGAFGPLLITGGMVLFAFTTLIGNLFYVDNCLHFIQRREPSLSFMWCFRIACVLAVFFGAVMSMEAVWAIADILMGLMCLINIPACLKLRHVAMAALQDYETQRKAGKNPIFKAQSAGIPTEDVAFWK